MIQDIKFIDGTATMYKKLFMSTKEIESQLKGIDYKNFYSYYKGRVADEVEKANLPFIMLAFYHYVFVEERVPTPQDLLDEYYFLNRKSITRYGDDYINFDGRTFQKKDVDARVLRAYPSLIRDLHMFSLLSESKCFDKVSYSFVDDMNGADIVITHQGKQFIVSLFVQTKRSQEFKKYKNTVRHQYGNNEIQVPLDFALASQCGDFYLYNKTNLFYIQDQIKNWR